MVSYVYRWECWTFPLTWNKFAVEEDCFFMVPLSPKYYFLFQKEALIISFTAKDIHKRFSVFLVMHFHFLML